MTEGQLTDEDWGLVVASAFPFVAYSNTLLSITDGDLNYSTVDLGFDLFKGPSAKAGPFVGYNRYRNKMETTDCRQLPAASLMSGICSPPIIDTPVIAERADWESLRLGVAAEILLADRVKLAAEAAYLPIVDFNGKDNHFLRDLVVDQDGEGQGVQLEAILSYSIDERFSLGVGGRYWSMWTTEGSDATSFGGAPFDPQDRNTAYLEHRYGAFLQGSYKLGWARQTKRN